MDMDEFHDFVVEVGLETADYSFDVMTNQFIKVFVRACTSFVRASHTTFA